MIRSLPSSLFGPIRHGVLKPFADDAKFDHVVWIVGSQSAAENSDNYNDLKSRGDFCTLPKLQLQKCKLRQISILELFVSLCCDYKVAAVPIKQPTERRVEAVN